MSEFVIEKGIVIDDIETVFEGIKELSNKSISGPETFRKFITHEKATKFYIDGKCKCRMLPDKDTVYLWLDSGYTDQYGNPIMISLINTNGEFRGHFFGPFKTLIHAIRSFFPRNSREINRNYGNLRSKYEHKISSRHIKHIDDENDFFLSVINDEEDFNVMKHALAEIDIQCEEPENIEEESIEESEREPGYDMNFREKEITIGLLLETIDGMQTYIDELLGEIEKFNSVDKVRMDELEKKNAEYKAALVRMRDFVGNEADRNTKSSPEGFSGHELLGRNKKILVLGATALDQNTMSGIAKLYGFEKKDFEYETDYKRVVNYAGRINSNNRYAAIIFGACPHKVSDLGEWSSLIEKFRQCEDLPFSYDARNHSGELKVTKESFKHALWNVCNEFRMKWAV